MKSLLLLIYCVMMSCSALAQEARSVEMQKRMKAAHDLMEVMDMKTQLDEAIKASMEIQIQQNPQLEQYRDVMMAFLSKYFNYETLEEPLSTIYAEAFTEKELNDLVAFYKTPTGRKAAKIQPELMQKGMLMGQQEVQKNLPELQRMIMERMQEIESAPEPPAPSEE